MPETPSPSVAANRRVPLWVVAAIVLVSLFLYRGIFGVTFLADDVVDYVKGEEVVRNEIWYPFIGKGMWRDGPQYYRPLTIVTYGLDALIWGYNPAGHRATQLLWHLACCLAVYALFRSWLGRARWGAAALAALLFALHPVHEYPMWWPGARYDVMCGAFYAGAAYFFTAYVREGRRRTMIFTLLCAAAALSSKEMAYSLPLMCFAIHLAFAQDRKAWPGRIWAAAWGAAPIAAVAAGFLAFRFVRYDAANTLMGVQFGLEHLRAALHAAARGLLFPFHVSLREQMQARPFVVVGVALLLGALVVRRVGRLRSPLAIVGAAWVVLTLLPVLRTMAPWTLYIPSIGFCLVAGLVLAPERNRRGAAAGLLAAVLIASYFAQWEYRRRTWIEMDRAALRFMDTLRADFRAKPFERALFLAIPGSIGDVPLYMQYFSLRLPLEMPGGAPEATVLSTTVLPAERSAQGVEVEVLDPGAWRLSLESPEAHFAFSESPQLLYRFDRGDVGDVVSFPWGSAEVLAENPGGQPNTIAVRLAGDAARWAGVPVYYFSRGELRRMPADGL